MERSDLEPGARERPEPRGATGGRQLGEPIGPPVLSRNELMLEALGISGQLEIRRVGADDSPHPDSSGKA